MSGGGQDGEQGAENRGQCKAAQLAVQDDLQKPGGGDLLWHHPEGCGLVEGYVPVPCCNIPVPLDCILILRGYIPQKNVMKIVAYLSLLRCRTHFAQTNFVPLNFMVATIYRIIFSRPTTLASFFWRTCPRGEGN